MGNLEVNGATLYYEMHGQGEPLVRIHGCGKDITLRETQIEPFEITLAKSIEATSLDKLEQS